MSNDIKVAGNTPPYKNMVENQASCISHNNGAHLHNINSLSAQDIDLMLTEAEQRCRKKGLRFTTLRRNVYRLILQADKPIGAYDLIQSLQECRHKRQGKEAKLVAPPTIYRTLDFLLELGVLHQLTSINAFVACCSPWKQHRAVFLLCKNCQTVQEYSSLSVRDIISEISHDVGFNVEHSVMEFEGTCQHCFPITQNNPNPSVGV